MSLNSQSLIGTRLKMQDDEDKGTVIQFPGPKKSKPKDEEKERVSQHHQKPIRVTKDSISLLIKALSTIHMATTYRAKKVESCKENLLKANFPCKLNCACYVNICAAMGLEAFLGGPTQEEASLLVEAEHELMINVYKDLYDEDEGFEE